MKLIASLLVTLLALSPAASAQDTRILPMGNDTVVIYPKAGTPPRDGGTIRTMGNDTITITP